MKLWEYEHPYYMAEGNYFQGGNAESYDSFDAFLESWTDSDVDLNRIHRWDWNVDEETGKVSNTLDLFYVMQRKAFTYSVHVKVKPEDHDRIKEFLKPHAELNFKLWKGIL